MPLNMAPKAVAVKAMPVTDASASVKQADAVEPVMKKPRTAQTAAQTLFTMWAKPMGA